MSLLLALQSATITVALAATDPADSGSFGVTVTPAPAPVAEVTGGRIMLHDVQYAYRLGWSRAKVRELLTTDEDLIDQVYGKAEPANDEAKEAEDAQAAERRRKQQQAIALMLLLD